MNDDLDDFPLTASDLCIALVGAVFIGLFFAGVLG